MPGGIVAVEMPQSERPQGVFESDPTANRLFLLPTFEVLPRLAGSWQFMELVYGHLNFSPLPRLQLGGGTFSLLPGAMVAGGAKVRLLNLLDGNAGLAVGATFWTNGPLWRDDLEEEFQGRALYMTAGLRSGPWEAHIAAFGLAYNSGRDAVYIQSLEFDSHGSDWQKQTLIGGGFKTPLAAPVIGVFEWWLSGIEEDPVLVIVPGWRTTRDGISADLCSPSIFIQDRVEFALLPLFLFAKRFN